MEILSPTTVAGASGRTGAATSVADLSSDDFFRLLITELQHQDPLEPMDNADLLRQISSIREIELNATLTDSLQSLTGQQGFASASSLIGQFVTTHPDEFGNVQAGVVVGVRIVPGASPVLQLADGSEVSIDRVNLIEPALKAAEALVGQNVIGLDRRDVIHPEVVEGVVTGVRIDSLGDTMLELDTGEDLRFKDVVQVVAGDLV